MLLISQWPDTKNGEYELIERIKRLKYKTAVVDYFGFDIETGECLNRANLAEDYDFAISFHYETPVLLNIPTYLWVANPLEFMYMRHDYPTTIFHNLRAYDDYLYNGSEFLKAHIRRVVGREWTDSGLEMFPACAASEMLPPSLAERGEHSAKIFYCGVNWERASDKTGRAQGLLDELQLRDVADFYGPAKLGTMSTWDGFTSYRGEVPFDGVSMLKTMRLYGAVLAVSSPAHLKSRTSSSRVFEATAAGVPVISDRNPHVQALFGDTVYYFDGDTREEKVSSIVARLQEIKSNPAEAARRVAEAQDRMAKRFCFEPSYAKALAFTRAKQVLTAQEKPATIDVFLFHHDLDPDGKGAGKTFDNAAHVAHSLRCAVNLRGARVKLFYCVDQVPAEFDALAALGVTIERVSTGELGLEDWDTTRLGRKIARLALKGDADLTVFFSQFDYPHYDYFTRAIDGLDRRTDEAGNFVRVAGFYASGLDHETRPLPDAILRVNSPASMYRWSQSSFEEHDLGALTFGREAVALLKEERIAPFDAILASTLVVLAEVSNVRVERARHISLRVRFNAFQRHFEAWKKESKKGFWFQHYTTKTNFSHEINALYDVVHESRAGVEIANAVSGRTNQIAGPDPDTRMVAKNIQRVRNIFRSYHNLRKKLGLKRS
jgi:glycosyltransferase involved in cell wall biosynthesis